MLKCYQSVNVILLTRLNRTRKVARAFGESLFCTNESVVYVLKNKDYFNE